MIFYIILADFLGIVLFFLVFRWGSAQGFSFEEEIYEGGAHKIQILIRETLGSFFFELFYFVFAVLFVLLTLACLTVAYLSIPQLGLPTYVHQCAIPQRAKPHNEACVQQVTRERGTLFASWKIVSETQHSSRGLPPVVFSLCVCVCLVSMCHVAYWQFARVS